MYRKGVGLSFSLTDVARPRLGLPCAVGSDRTTGSGKLENVGSHVRPRFSLLIGYR